MKCFIAIIINLYYWATMASANIFDTEPARPDPIDDLSKINGTWEGYKKANLKLSLSCLSYNITCASNSQCNVTLVRTNPQDSGNTSYTMEQIENGAIRVTDDFIFKVFLGTNARYAIAWKDGETDQLVVLLKDTKNPDDETDKEIDEEISKWNFTKGTVKKIDQSPCGTGNMITISSASVLFLVYFVIASIS